MDYNTDIDNTMSHFNDNLIGNSNHNHNHNPHHVGVNDVVIGLIFSFAILACGLYLSHMYSVEEQEEIAAAEQIRIEAENKKIKDMESYRVKITNAIDCFSIRLTKMTSSRSLPLSPSRHNVKVVADEESDNRTVPSGSDDEEQETGTWAIKVTDIEIPVSIDLTVSDPPLSSSSDEEQQDQPAIAASSSSLSLSSSTRTMTRSNLRDAVTYNPCVICLDHFRPGDVIVCCSNNMNGQKPHVFHQACSLDYILSHNDGMKAPCPCCKRALLPSESQRKGYLKHCQQSVLTLPELCESESFGEEDETSLSGTEE
mmetsp:Transcript_27299/g.63935  ORF Transcript_27299/g.63935 Transcript_27299/m.63935 type:complete len:313 (-) Transcript_27299:301-1239(-)